MQNKKNLFRLLTFLSTVTFFILPMRAQMTVGDDTAPHKFSLVEIDTTYQNGGLRLPQLTAAECDSLKTTILSSTDNKAAAKGLVVYNATTGCLEFWRGEDWESVCEESASGDYSAYLLPACDVPDQPGAITGPRGVSTKATGSITYSIAPVTDAASYTWSLPVGWKISGASTGTSITIAPLTAMAQSGAISVTANNTCGSSVPRTLNVIIGCGAFIAPDVWREFMCYNLGADESLDPFNPVEGLNGDYYQWGSKTPMATVDGLISGYSPTPDVFYGDNTTTSTTIKSETDPCPIGFRIPNNDEWNGVMSLNTRTDKGAWTANGDCMDCWAGAMMGDALFLPAPGLQYHRYGIFGDRGKYGFYQSSTLWSSTNSSAGVIQTWSDVESSDPLDGISVRCIKQ